MIGIIEPGSMASATPPPPPPPSLTPPALTPPPLPEAGASAAAPSGARRLPTDDEIQRILSSQPKGLEPQSPFREFSITALIGYIAGAALVFTGLSSQGKTADQHSAQAVNVAGGFAVICLASICRHTKRMSSKKDS